MKDMLSVYNTLSQIDIIYKIMHGMFQFYRECTLLFNSNENLFLNMKKVIFISYVST